MMPFLRRLRYKLLKRIPGTKEHSCYILFEKYLGRPSIFDLTGKHSVSPEESSTAIKLYEEKHK